VGEIKKGNKERRKGWKTQLLHRPINQKKRGIE